MKLIRKIFLALVLSANVFPATALSSIVINADRGTYEYTNDGIPVTSHVYEGCWIDQERRSNSYKNPSAMHPPNSGLTNVQFGDSRKTVYVHRYAMHDAMVKVAEGKKQGKCVEFAYD